MTQELTSTTQAQAARWFAAQRRRLGTLEELESFRQWAENAANRVAFARLHALWAELGQLYANDDTLMLARPVRRFGVAIGCVAAATFGLMCCIDGAFWTSLDWTTR